MSFWSLSNDFFDIEINDNVLSHLSDATSSLLT